MRCTGDGFASTTIFTDLEIHKCCRKIIDELCSYGLFTGRVQHPDPPVDKLESVPSSSFIDAGLFEHFDVRTENS